MGIKYDSREDMRNGKYGDELEIVKSEEAHGQTVHIVKIPSQSEGHRHRVAIEDEDGFLLGGISRSREDIKTNFQNAIENIETDWIAEAKEYFSDKNFKIVGETESNTGRPAIELFATGYKFTLDEQDIKNDYHKYVNRHWNVIKEVVSDVLSGHSDSVFYSNIQNRLDHRVPYANRDSSGAMFHTTVEILENKGLRVHS